MTSISEIRPTAKLEPAASNFRVRRWSQLVPMKLSGLWTDLNRGPNCNRHSDLTNTLLAVNLHWGSSCLWTLCDTCCQPNTVVESLNLILRIRPRGCTFWSKILFFFSPLRSIHGLCSKVCQNCYLANLFPYHSTPSSMTDWCCCSIYQGCKQITVFLLVK